MPYPTYAAVLLWLWQALLNIYYIFRLEFYPCIGKTSLFCLEEVTNSLHYRSFIQQDTDLHMLLAKQINGGMQSLLCWYLRMLLTVAAQIIVMHHLHCYSLHCPSHPYNPSIANKTTLHSFDVSLTEH